MNIVIVGAGPAGCAAAIGLAQRGIKPVLLDRERFPRHRPGESLHPGIEPVLRELGLWEPVATAGFLRHAGIWVEWDAPRRFVQFGNDSSGRWYGLQANRSHFDCLLLQRACECGATYLPVAAQQIKTSGRRVVRVTTRAGELETDYLFDASGSAQWLRRQLNLPTRFHSVPLVARYGYATGHSRSTFPAIIADREGWTWLAQIDPTTYHWTRVTATEHQTPHRIPAVFASMPIYNCRGADVQWRISDVTAARNWFILGDAGCLLDPSSSHGVLRAIMSGMMAANVLATCQPPAVYDQWLRQWFHADAEHMRRSYTAVGLF